MATRRIGDRVSFESHDVSGLFSVAHLFPRSRGRTGIYVLHFKNGEGYVGKSIDVVSRWASHRRKWEDIVTLEFTRVARTALTEVEQSQIRSRQAMMPLRNIQHAFGDGIAEADIDLVVEHTDQFAWLNGDDWSILDAEGRVEDQELRFAKRAQFQKLSMRDDFEALIFLLQVYVHFTVPCPRATELTFWALSAMPNTNKSTRPRMAAVSINAMETAVVGYEKEDPSVAWGFINVSRSALEEAGTSVKEFCRRHPSAYTDGRAHYATSGHDALSVFFDPVHAMREALVSDEDFLHAARSLNLRLMRKGPTVQWHGHCFDLADRVLELDAEAEA